MALTVTTNKTYADYCDTSTSSQAVRSSTYTLTVSAGKPWVAGDDLMLVPTAAKIPMRIQCTVTSYSGTTLVLAPQSYGSTDTVYDVLTSSSSNTIGTGAKTFIVPSGQSSLLAAADTIMVIRVGNVTGTYMTGTVTSYNNTDGTLVINSAASAGSGTYTDWIVVSTGTYTAWDIAPATRSTGTITLSGTSTFTIDTQPTYSLPGFASTDRGTIFINNASTTNPIVVQLAHKNKTIQFETNSTFKTRGAWISIKTGDGTAAQTIDLSGSPYTKIDMPMVEVETGSGTGVYRPWYVCPNSTMSYGANGTNYIARLRYAFASTFGKGLGGNVCLWNAATRILTFGDDTNGNVIPNGAKVRMPNIYVTSTYMRTHIMSAIGTGVLSVDLGYNANITTSPTNWIIDNEEVTGTLTGSTLSITARAQNGTTAAAHSQGAFIYVVLAGSSTSNNNRSLMDSDPGGKVDLQISAFTNIFCQFSNFQSLSIVDCHFTALNVTSSASDATLTRVTGHIWPQSDPIILQCQSVLGVANVSYLYAMASQGSLTSSINIANNSALNLSYIEAVCPPRVAGGTSVLTFVANICSSVVSNLTVNGGRLNLQNAANFEVDTVALSDNMLGVDGTGNVSNAVIFQNVQNVILRNLTKLAFGAAARSGFLSTDVNCSNVLVHTATYEHNNNTISSTFAGKNIRLVNAVLGTVRDGAGTTGDSGISSSATGDTVNLQNVIFTLPSTYGTANGWGYTARCFFEYCSGVSGVWQTAGSVGGNMAEMGPYHVFLDGTTKTTGTLCCGSFGVEASRDIYDFTGTAYADNGGYLILPAINDSIIVKSYQALRSITGFRSVAVDPEDINPGNLTYEFELQNYGDSFAASWTSLTYANLQTKFAALVGYDSNVGLAIRIRITATGASATNTVKNIRMFTTNDGSFNPPIGYVDYNVTGLSAASVVGAFDGVTEIEYDAGLSGTHAAGLRYDYDGIDATADIKIRSYLTNWDDHSISYNQTEQTHASTQTTDTEVTEATVANVIAYTSLGTCAKIYDYAKYWGTLRANLLVDLVCTKSGNALNFGAYDVVIDKTAVSVFSKSSNTITIKADYVDTGSITTTGTITLSNGAVTGTAYLTGSNGASALFTISCAAGTSVVVYDETTARVSYVASSGTTVVNVVPFGSTGNWTWKATKYGYLPLEGSVAVSGGGSLVATATLEADPYITEAVVATVAAYATLSTLDQVYDYIAYSETLTNFIDYDRTVSKSGTVLDGGAKNITIAAAAASVFIYSGGATFTLKSAALDQGVDLLQFQTSGTMTLTGSTAGTAPLSASNGKSAYVTVNSLTAASVIICTSTDTVHDYQTAVTGTYNSIIPFGSTGTWVLVTKRLGYRHAVLNFTASDGGFVEATPSMPQKLNPDGTAMYTGTTTVYVQVSFLEGVQASIDIADGTAPLQATVDMTEDALMTQDGMEWFCDGFSDVSQFNSAGGDYLFLSTGWRLRRWNVGDNQATLNAFCVGADGTIVDGTNGGVQFLTSDSPTAIAAAVWASVDAFTKKQFLALK